MTLTVEERQAKIDKWMADEKKRREEWPAVLEQLRKDAPYITAAKLMRQATVKK